MVVVMVMLLRLDNFNITFIGFLLSESLQNSSGLVIMYIYNIKLSYKYYQDLRCIVRLKKIYRKFGKREKINSQKYQLDVLTFYI